MPHGFDDHEWERAKAEGHAAMVAVARRRAMITYGELFGRHVTSIRLDPHDPRVASFLDEVSRAEDEAGHGMLSVVVVHKLGDMEPGAGFYTLAEELGRDVRDHQAMWIAELHRVHAQWAQR